MKKILFVCVNLNPGGIRTALINLLKTTVENDIEYCIQVLTNREEDIRQFDKIKEISKSISIKRPLLLYEIYYSSLKELLYKHKFCRAFLKIIMILMRAVFGAKNVLDIICLFSRNAGEFDVAISFDNDIWGSHRRYSGGANRYVLKKTNAKKKIAWIHAEPSYYGLTHEIGVKEYRDFDTIVNVSNSCKEKFDRIVPEYCEKSKVVYNGLDVEYVKKIAARKCDLPEKKHNTLRLITVSRIVRKAKRSDRIIDIAQYLLNNAVDFEWYVIGDGELKSELQKQALEKCLPIYFLGNVDEPYNYISKCDLFVLPSEQESFGMVLAESLICGVPVVCTNFDAAREIVDSPKKGLIVDDTVEEIANGIIRLKDIANEMAGKCDYSNNAVEQFFEIVGELV